jgi:uncharacterized protein (DUF1919 family)
MRAKKINEVIDFNDPGSRKALAGWTQTFMGNSNFEKTVRVEEPFEITFKNEVDYAKLTFLLQKYRIPFEELETVEENLKFSDGMEFNTDGPLRAEERSDGWYVVGQGMLIPVASAEEAQEYIDNHRPGDKEFKKYIATGKPQGRATKSWDKYLRQ